MTSRPRSFDVLVIGAGPAGIAAACAAAERGRRVAVVDESPWLGGQIWRGAEAKKRPRAAARWISRLKRTDAELISETSIILAASPHLLRGERRGEPIDFACNRLILATGARERFLPFPGWVLPNVAGVGGLQALAKAGWPVAEKRVVIAGSGPLLFAVAEGLRKMRARIAVIAEQAPWSRVRGFALGLTRHPAKLAQAAALRASLRGIPYRCGVWPVRAEGQGRVERVVLSDGRTTWEEPCDYLACGFGLVPNTELAAHLGCEVRDGCVAVDELQATSVAGVFCVGEPTGVGGAECALIEGTIAGLAAADSSQLAQRFFRKRAAAHRFRDALKRTFALQPPLARLASDDTIICRCEDVAYSAMSRYPNWREAKLQTRCGMGPCQGRVCGAAAEVIFGWGAESVRPPVSPASLATIAALFPDNPNLTSETPT